METENNTPQRRRERRTPKNTQQRPKEEIQYTQPKPFLRKRLMIQLLTMAAVVLAVAIGVSVFFQVDEVLVTGASQYSALTVAEASKIETGDSLLFFGRAAAASRIKSALPYVSSVRFEVKLPGTVNIIIEEKLASYAVEAADGSWWKVTSEGKIVEKVENTALTGPTITGVTLKEPEIGKKAVAVEQEGEMVTTTGKEMLNAALKIISKVEKWELFEQVTDVDVSDLFGLRLSCTGNYRVELGSEEDLDKKIQAVKSALIVLENNSGGVIKLQEKNGKWEVQYSPWTENS